MKNLMTFEQFLNEANVTPYNLKIGYIYKSDFEIKQGTNKGKRCITEQEYVGYNGNNYTFKIVKILTPDTFNHQVKVIKRGNAFYQNLGFTMNISNDGHLLIQSGLKINNWKTNNERKLISRMDPHHRDLSGG